tara:strand:- start:271 stop:465 length:195 start_codon:yes stop_codon:yes gene_type:complete
MKINDRDLLDQPLFDPLNSVKEERKCTRRWVVGLWVATNVVTFVFGYLVKSSFDDEDKDLNGSL